MFRRACTLRRVTVAPLMLSVSGLRGIVGASMTPQTARRFARAVATDLRVRQHPGRTVVIGRDGRGSGGELAQGAIAELQECGLDTMDLGIVATPTVSWMVRAQRAAAGLVITASHNPIEWNGLKVIDSTGAAPGAEAAGRISNWFNHENRDLTLGVPAGQSLNGPDADALHAAAVAAQIDCAAVRRLMPRVILDSINGGGARSGRLLLEKLGATVAQVNGEHTGSFAHTPEPLEANLTALAESARNTRGLTAGFAQDPDADRLAVLDEHGRYIGEECTLALCAMRLLQRRGGGALATNLSTSRRIDDIARRFPGSCVSRSAVGEANVVEAMRAGSAILGGEGNGGVIWPEICWVRDSLSAMALILELLATEGRPLSAIVADLPSYAMVKRKISWAQLGGEEQIQPALTRVAAAFPGARVDRTDGLRVDLPEGWVHLRASNTEPIFRIIAEAATAAAANDLCDRCERVIGLAD